MSGTENSIAETITTLKLALRGWSEIANALSAPLPAKEQIISYCNLKIDQTTGRCWYKKKEYRLKKGGITYIVLNLLIARMGHPVSYNEMFQAIKEVRGDGIETTKTMISSSIRESRRKFGINSKTHPQDDIFLATGNGYRLISR